MINKTKQQANNLHVEHSTVGREMIATRFNTGSKLPTWKEEREWIEQLSEGEKLRVYKQANL